MERLWAPWRLEYVQHADEQDGCVFCTAAAGDDAEGLVVHRGKRAFALLNRFPYSSGHLMVAPYRHGAGFDSLDDGEALEVHELSVQAIEALRAVYAPDGFNVGWNLGRVAGAGIVDHGHVHVVPRWSGDTNFMPVLADVRVIPEHLTETRHRLVDAWPA
jgi:ATP adenylyltransferase